MINKAWNFGIPLTLVTVYRLVPNGIRGRYPYFGKKPSSSHLAVLGLYRGQGWSAVRSAIVDQGGYHPDR